MGSTGISSSGRSLPQINISGINASPLNEALRKSEDKENAFSGVSGVYVEDLIDAYRPLFNALTNASKQPLTSTERRELEATYINWFNSQPGRTQLEKGLFEEEVLKAVRVV